ncbi:MAG: sigma 54-interacting transcriptional regulator [Myxococcales bacterium]|nr:sigma 54-interacting transcriptional regulator [Myxococcales bacterium]
MQDPTTLEHSAASVAAAQAPDKPSGALASLVVHHDGGGSVRTLGPGSRCTVGRGFPAELTVDDRSLSRQHARFEFEGGKLWVEDLGSKNGTWIAGQRVERRQLRPGEVVHMGRAVATLHLLGTETSDPAATTGAEPAFFGSTMADLYETVERVAPTTVPVLIVGETGSGKERVASTLHKLSERREGPLCVINCAAIPESLAESLLFGHQRGAFTGAAASSRGLFEQADGGVLFLDEIGELSLANQAALLRTLETRTVQPLGSPRAVAVDVRVVAATHRDLRAMIAEGRFRDDLFYRLNAVTLRVPPLRDRRDEIAPLAEHFQASAAALWGVARRKLSPALQAHLRALPWPGNIRQLKNAIEHASLVARGTMLDVCDLPQELGSGAVASFMEALPQSRGSESSETEAFSRSDTVPLPTGEPPSPKSSADGGGLTFKQRVLRYEKELIAEALQQTGGNRRAAARLLKIPIRTLTHKLASLDLKGPRSGDD